MTTPSMRGEGELCLHELIAKQSTERPDAPAVVLDGAAEATATVTYADLRQRATRLAHHLRARGVQPDTLVGICAERSPALVIGILAILEAGGAYLALDPEDPPARTRTLLEDAEPRLLLVGPHIQDLGERSHKSSTETWVMDSLGAVAPIQDPVPPPVHGPTSKRESAATNLAYVLFTSGSTGRPKGVMVEHRSIVNRLLWARDTFELGPGDAVLQKTPLGFDVSVTEIFWPLVSGARLILARPGGQRDPGYLADLVERERVTVLHFVPSMLAAFLDVPDVARRCRSVRHVLAGGEVLPPAVVKRFYEEVPPPTMLHNLYGPTEATVAVTHQAIPRDFDEKNAPIGKPVPNTSVYVLDRDGRRVLEGETGEIYIGGIQVARGYLNRPELIREFISDPYAGEAGGSIASAQARMYRTGDRGRRRADGAFEFLGRLDRQVKLRGARIEPGEVEAALLRQPGIREAAVAVHEGATGEPRLIAYVVGDDGKAPGPSKLHRSLSGELPDAMVPSAFIEMGALPRGSGEKVDWDRLPDPSNERPVLEEPYAPPRNDLERFLVELWTTTLGLDRVGIRDRFFELGGSSLQAARIVNGAAERLGEPVYVVTLFEAPTVEGYARLLERDYPVAVQRTFGSAGEGAGHERRPPRRPLGADEEERFRAAVPRYVEPRTRRAPRDRNPPALFILAPPRSGTTLLRVMLAGHPGIFASPELQLLGFENLRQRRDALSGKHSLWLEGTVRAVMELKGCGPEKAWRVMAEHEDSGLSTQDFFRVLQDWVAPKLLADKSPAYALDPAVLQKAETDFREALYVHLVRHPWSTIRSFQRQHLEQVLFLQRHDFEAAEVAELVWRVSHSNVRAFLESVPSARWFRVSFEELVRRPEPTMKGLCQHLGFPFEPGVADPYASLDGKMVDGLYPESTPMGDRSLLGRDRIDPAVADRHLDEVDPAKLHARTWELARELGYPDAEVDGAHPELDPPIERALGGGRDRAGLRRGLLTAFARSPARRSRGKASDPHED